MAGAGGPKPGSANMEFKEMKEESTTPPTVEYEHIKACIVFFSCFLPLQCFLATIFLCLGCLYTFYGCLNTYFGIYQTNYIKGMDQMQELPEYEDLTTAKVFPSPPSRHFQEKH